MQQIHSSFKAPSKLEVPPRNTLKCFTGLVNSQISNNSRAPNSAVLCLPRSLAGKPMNTNRKHFFLPVVCSTMPHKKGKHSTDSIPWGKPAVLKILFQLENSSIGIPALFPLGQLNVHRIMQNTFIPTFNISVMRRHQNYCRVAWLKQGQ